MNDHPNKEIRAAVDYALAHGWRLIKAGAHAPIWGTLLCHRKEREGCRKGVFSTPTNPRNYAQWLRKQVDSCPHGKMLDSERL